MRDGHLQPSPVAGRAGKFQLQSTGWKGGCQSEPITHTGPGLPSHMQGASPLLLTATTAHPPADGSRWSTSITLTYCLIPARKRENQVRRTAVTPPSSTNRGLLAPALQHSRFGSQHFPSCFLPQPPALLAAPFHLSISSWTRKQGRNPSAAPRPEVLQSLSGDMGPPRPPHAHPQPRGYRAPRSLIRRESCCCCLEAMTGA